MNDETNPRADETEDDYVPTGPLLGAEAVKTIVIKQLEDNKAEEIVTIDLAGKTAMADAMIIASGRSARQVNALAEYILKALKDGGHGHARVEGMPSCDWVLIDAGDVIIHLFRPEVRAFYNLEKMWSSSRPAAERLTS